MYPPVRHSRRNLSIYLDDYYREMLTLSLLLFFYSTVTYCLFGADDSTYDTVFQTTKGDTLIVRVHFPAQQIGSSQKHRAPAMTMAGVRARHPWLDSRMRITGYPPISSDEKWKASHMLLGQAVHEVVKHLQLESPEVLEITDAGLQSIQQNSHKQRSGNGTSNGSTNSRSTSAHVVQRGAARADAPPEYSTVLLDMPDIPRQFAELDGLSREELDALLEDELEFTAFINQLPTFQSIQSTANDILDENAVMAKANLEKEDKVKSLYKDVTDLKNQMESKLKLFQTLEREQDALCAPPDTKDVLRQLARGKKESFQESERLAEEWVQDGTDVDKFTDEFVQKRLVHHLRAAKMERIQTTAKHTKTL